MIRRSHKRRKQFSCGHRGFGRFCHRCIGVIHTDHPLPSDDIASRPTPQPQTPRVWRATAKRTTKQPTAKQRAAKQQWQQSFASDPIDLTHLPKPIVIKTRQILAALNQGIAPNELQGRRFNFDRTLLRIPVTYRYRLLCRWYTDRIIPIQVLTHEAYNAIARNKKRVKRS
jgi:hypothetical protein